MVGYTFGGTGMHISPGRHLPTASRGKRGAARGYAPRGTRQRGRWNGAPTGRGGGKSLPNAYAPTGRGGGKSLPNAYAPTGRGGGKSLPNAYPSQPSRTLANVIRFQKRRGILGGTLAQGLYHDSTAELRKQFPVSSGSQHREKENPGPKIPAHLKLKLPEGQCNAPLPPQHGASTSTPRFGMKILQRMGWSPGKGLGKYEEGTIEPVVPDGLYVPEYQPKTKPMQVMEDMSAKHPVMALTELCTRHKWPAPKFEVVDHAGPDHKKTFMMKVIVNGQEFKSEEAYSSKKQAKAEAAALFLESIGLYDRKKAPQWN